MIRRKKPVLNLFGKIILIFNYIATLALLISYLAPITNPNSFWLIPFFGLAYPAFLLINIAFIIFWLLYRKSLFSLISLVAILGGYNFIAKYVGFRESSAIEVPKSSENFIRVMTYNVHNFKRYEDKLNDIFTKDEILNIIRKEQPDILCIQEFLSRPKSDYNFKELLKEILNTKYYYFKPDMDNGYEAIGMAIFSKFPIKKSDNIHFDDSANGALFSDIEYKNKLFRIYNVHFQSISFQPEDYKYIKKVKGIEADVTSSRRIGSRLKGAFKKRSNQISQIKDHASKCLIPYVIAGDFNDTPISYAVNEMSSGLVNSFYEKGSGLGVTYNGDFPNFQIDYILATKNFEVKNYRIVKKELSDHYAVRSDLEWNK